MIWRRSSINRNIVECKEAERPKRQECKKVLIETLWNVKYSNIRIGVDCMTELLKKYQNNYHKALTAYRWGPTGAERNYFSQKKYTCEYAEAVLEKASRIKRKLEQGQ